MKVRSLFYFILFFSFAFSGCKKEEVTPTNIEGQWYVERFTRYSTGSGYNTGYYEYTPTENYESVGLFKFNDNGTGVYTFESQVVPFTYSITESIKTYNGMGKTPDDYSMILKFDKSAITSLNSPILYVYYTFDVEYYEVFSRTKGTLRFRGNFNSYATSYTNENNVEFILTKQ